MSFIAAGYGTVSDIEIAWTAIAALGAALSVSNVRDALADLRATDHLRPLNGRRSIAVTGLKVEVARLVIQTIFTIIGALAMCVPDPPPVSMLPWEFATLGIVFRWGLIISACLILYQSIENRRLRQVLREQVARDAATEGGTT